MAGAVAGVVPPPPPQLGPGQSYSVSGVTRPNYSITSHESKGFEPCVLQMHAYENGLPQRPANPEMYISAVEFFLFLSREHSIKFPRVARVSASVCWCNWLVSVHGGQICLWMQASWKPQNKATANRFAPKSELCRSFFFDEKMHCAPPFESNPRQLLPSYTY